MIDSRFLAVILSVLSVFSADALRVVVDAPGSLCERVTDPLTLTRLELGGDIDVRDLRFVADEMPALSTLDLSSAKIVSHLAYPAGTIPSGVFAGCGLSEVVLPAGEPVSIGDMAFMSSGLTDLRLGDNIQAIGQGAFAGCLSLRSVDIVGSPVMGSHVFAGCSDLKSVAMEAIERIGEAAFESCTALAEVVSAGCLREIGPKSFSGCNSLSNFDFGRELVSVGEEAFASTAIVRADMSECLSLTDISPWAFADCPDLETVGLPVNLRLVSPGLLFGDDGLVSVSMPSGLTEIADYAFCSVSSLDSVALPQSLGRIGDLAMCRMSSLDIVDARNLSAVPDLGDDVWDDVSCADVRLRVAGGMKGAFAGAAQWNDFNIIEDAMSGIISADNISSSGITCRLDGHRIVIVSDSSPLQRVNIYTSDGRLLTSATPGSDRFYYDAGVNSFLLVEAVSGDGHKTIEKVSIYGKK